MKAPNRRAGVCLGPTRHRHLVQQGAVEEAALVGRDSAGEGLGLCAVVERQRLDLHGHIIARLGIVPDRSPSLSR